MQFKLYESNFDLTCCQPTTIYIESTRSVEIILLGSPQSPNLTTKFVCHRIISKKTVELRNFLGKKP